MKNYTFITVPPPLPAELNPDKNSWPKVIVSAADANTAKNLIVEELKLVHGVIFVEETEIPEGEPLTHRLTVIRPDGVPPVSKDISLETLAKVLG
jgi:hypothetical protein